MTGLKKARKCTIFTFCVVAAGCTAQQSVDGGSNKPTAQVSAPGSAQCFVTTADENRTAAAATNSVRGQAGLPAVRANATLAKAAAEHACDMAKRGNMTHAGSSSVGPSSRVKALGYSPTVTAENIAAGPYELNQVLSVWSGSSGHLANIRNPRVRDFGIGHAIGSDGKTRFWAAVYAAPR